MLRCGALGQLAALHDLLVELAPDPLGRAAEQHLAERGAVHRRAAPRAHTDRDLARRSARFEMHDLEAIAHREVHRLAGLLEQLIEHRPRALEQRARAGERLTERVAREPQPIAPRLRGTAR